MKKGGYEFHPSNVINTAAQNHPRHKFWVLLTTSVVLEDKKELKALLDLPDNCAVLLPEDTYWELMLLAKHATGNVVRDKAKYVLEMFPFDRCGYFSKRELYTNEILQKENADTPPLNEYVFLSYEPSAVEELAELFCDCRHVYLLHCDPYRPDMFQQELYKATDLKKAMDKNHGHLYRYNPDDTARTSEYFDVFKDLDREEGVRSDEVHLLLIDATQPIGEVPGKGVSITLNEGDLVAGNGGEANIFKCCIPGVPDGRRLMKIYKGKNGLPTSAFVDKLSAMGRLHDKLEMGAFPMELVYGKKDGKLRCIGFTMKKIDAKSLDSLERNNELTRNDELEFIKLFFARLLELSIEQFYAVDVSPGNFLYDQEKDTVYVVDVDSMEVAGHPGGSYTGVFGHPEVQQAFEAKEVPLLRKRAHVNFAISVMVWYEMMGWATAAYNPLIQKKMLSGYFDNEEYKHKEWLSGISFPYANGRLGGGCASKKGNGVSSKSLLAWKQLNLPARMLFVDTFSMDKQHRPMNECVPGIGDWIAALPWLKNQLKKEGKRNAR